MSAQSATNRSASQGNEVAAMAQARALEAIMKSGQLGGSIEAQDFGQQAQQSSAQDAINRFNTQNRQSVNSANTGIGNAAQYANLAAAQSLADRNTDLGNQQTKYNEIDLLQNRYNNQFNTAAAKANALNGQASNLKQSAQNTQAFASGMGKAVDEGAAQIAGMIMGNPMAAKGGDTKPGVTGASTEDNMKAGHGG
jgi:hypothetical protein